jgi:A/G-specific adenine glycosylase
MTAKKASNQKKLQPIEFQKKLLNWFEKHGRKDLPWQSNKTPYRVWISEIMLQQTQVSTVIAYFQRFIKKFPDVITLSNAKEDEVLHVWTGLGYYQRARHLHRTAKIICQTYQGHFPDNLTQLETLPGIGRSTAGAILSIAFAKSAAILDGNVKRVLTRLYGITQWPGEKKTAEKLWKIAEKYSPKTKTADYTQAIMDLGATLCKRSKPACTQCPFNQHCIANIKGMTASLPQSKPRKTLPIRMATLLLLLQESHYVLLEKRRTSGVWKGLWSLPEIEGIQDQKTIRKMCLTQFSLSTKKIILGSAFRHTFTHYHLEILPALIVVKKEQSHFIDDQNQLWYNLQQNQAIGMPAPVKSLLNNLKKHGTLDTHSG